MSENRATIKVGIVEDELLIAHGIADTLEQLGYEPLAPVGSYTEALEMLAREKPDIVLLDIQLSGKKDGIDLATRVREDYDIPFIFLTANSDAATVERAKQLCPHAYLVKPFNKDELYTSIEICLHNFSIARESSQQEKGNYVIKDSVFIKQGQNFHKVRIGDIMYLESDNVYVHVHAAGAKFLVRSTIQHYLGLLGGETFFRVHRSFAVNINHVQTISSESLIVSGREIPLGRTYRDELLNVLRLG